MAEKQLVDMTEPELRELCDDLAAIVIDRLPEAALFGLLVFDGHGVTQYVSNARRDDMIKALREGADRLEAADDVRR